MATEPEPFAERRSGPMDGADEAPENLGSLIRNLTQELADLIRQEVNLARMEMRQAVASTIMDAAKIFVAVGLGLLGGLCLVVFGVLGIGRLLHGAYWAGALITGGALLLVGGVLTASAVRGLKRRSLRPKAAVDSLKSTARDARAIMGRDRRAAAVEQIPERTERRG